MECLNTKHTRYMFPVLTVGILPRNSGQCGQHTTGLSQSDDSHLVINKQYSVRYDQWHWEVALFKFRWNFLCSCCSITDRQLRSRRYSGVLCTETDESSWYTTAETSKVSSNIILYSTTTYRLQIFSKMS